MSVLTTTNRVDIAADGTTKTFAFSFQVYQKSDLQVWTIEPTGDVRLRLPDLEYTQSLQNTPGGVPGGTVTFLIAPASGWTVILMRVVSETQSVNFGNFDKDDAKSAVEQGFDLIELEIQRTKETVGRTLMQPTDVISTITDLPPVPAPQTFPSVIGYKPTGGAIRTTIAPGDRTYTFSGVFLANHQVFSAPGTYTFNVPVTTIYFIMYGASGGGGGGGKVRNGKNGGCGVRGGDGGFAQVFYDNYTIGEVLDIVVGAGGTGGAKSTGSNGNIGNQGNSTSVARRAPHAVDAIVIGQAEGGPGGFDGRANGSDGGIANVHSPIGGFAAGGGNFLIQYSPGFGYLLYKGNYGGLGGKGGYVVDIREIELDENDITEYGSIIPPDDGGSGQSGIVAIYW